MTSHSHKPKTFLFNPFEIAFCGYSGSGKTTLIKKLVSNFSSKYKIGYVKHDAHSFQIDKEGKDTYEVKLSGADNVFINDSEHYAFIKSGEADNILSKNIFINSDIVFIEGYKNSHVAKIVFIDEQKEILKKLTDFENVIALVGQENEPNTEIKIDVPYFHRDNIIEIENFIEKHLTKKLNKIPFYGLVLSGGKSTRMKKDKSLLLYNGKHQLENSYSLLNKYCEKVFISTREDQKDLDIYKNFPQIHDLFLNFGPMSGILSAMTKYPETPWLVVANDLPLVTEKTLETLFKKRNPFKFATCYSSSEDNLPEPLCTIYEPKSKHRLMSFLSFGYSCPRKFLINSEVNIIKSENNVDLKNVNYPEEYESLINLK